MTTELGVWLQEQPSENRLHLLRHQPSYFAKGGEVGRLVAWLTDFGFLEQKLDAVGITALIEDYDLALPLVSGEEQRALRLIQGALRLSSHVVDEDPSQLAGQLLGRLLSFPEPEIQTFLELVKEAQDQPWFRPHFPCLDSPGGTLIRTFVGHRDSVTLVAVIPEGKIISGSNDGTLKVWDLETGRKLHTFTGNLWRISAVTVTPERKVISLSNNMELSGFEENLKVWDLETGTELLALTGNGGVLAVTLDKKVISRSPGGTLKVWDLETETELACFRESRRSRTTRDFRWKRNFCYL